MQRSLPDNAEATVAVTQHGDSVNTAACGCGRRTQAVCGGSASEAEPGVFTCELGLGLSRRGCSTKAAKRCVAPCPAAPTARE